jgi:phosphopantothenoylcysteine decarboxylase/phosphopantothenate--cysteine ligase
MAQACAEAGAAVTMVSGPTGLAVPTGVERVSVVSAAEMAAAVDARVAQCDVFIAVAAVADYTPAVSRSSKLKKSDAALTLELKPTVDILARVAARPNAPFCVGFAAETDDVESNADAKRRRKKVDLMVANRAQDALGSDENEVTLIDEAGARRLERMTKLQLAWNLVVEIAQRAN